MTKLFYIVNVINDVVAVAINVINVTGPLGALEIDSRPRVCCKESLELLFPSID